MIRENYPDSDLILFNYYTTSHPIQLELFPNKEFFSEIHLLPGNLSKIQFYLSFFKICLKHRYKKIFVLAGGVPKVLAFAAIFLQFRKLTSSLYLENSRGPIWKVYVEGLKKHGLSASDDIFDFPLTDAELNLGRETAKQIQKDQKLPLIAFGVGGKKPACLWKIENYIQVINSMKQKMSFIPVYVGGPSDRKNAVELIKSCGGIFLQDTNSKTLRESMAFFKHCYCYIGNDTGTAHLAATAGLKCAILYSAHSLPKGAWHPVGEGHLLIRKDISCAGCGKDVCPEGEFSPCMELIKPEDVVEKVIPWMEQLSESV